MPTTPSKINFATVRSLFFFLFIGALGMLSLYIFRPFLYPIFWAAVIAAMFHPIYRFLLQHTKLPKVSSSITMLLAITLVFLPLTLISILLVRQSLDLYDVVSKSSAALSIQTATTWINNTPLAPYYETLQNQYALHAGEVAQTVSAFIVQNFAVVTQASAWFIFELFIMLYALFYFLKDGPRMLRRLMHLSPLGDNYETILYDRFASISRATIKSTIIVGGIQGILGGLLFWATGVHAPVVWGIVMTAFSILPGLGAFVVWLPAGIIMLLLGFTPQGIAILMGGIVISSIDNLIRPPLLGRDTQMHPLIALLSTLGGLLLFGVSGFVIGPIIAGLFIAAIHMYEAYYRNDLAHNEK